MGTFIFLGGTHPRDEVELCEVLALFYKAKTRVPKFPWPFVQTLVSLLTVDHWMWTSAAHANFHEVLNAIDAMAAHAALVQRFRTVSTEGGDRIHSDTEGRTSSAL